MRVLSKETIYDMAHEAAYLVRQEQESALPRTTDIDCGTISMIETFFTLTIHPRLFESEGSMAYVPLCEGAEPDFFTTDEEKISARWGDEEEGLFIRFFNESMMYVYDFSDSDEVIEPEYEPDQYL